MHRNLRELDQELVKHGLVFGRGREKQAIFDLVTKGDRTVLLTGLGGMGKTSLMLDLLRDVGGVGSESTIKPGPSLFESGHSFYFEDLETFIRFLGVRDRPITFRRAGISVKWDDKHRGRKEVFLEAGKERGNEGFRDGRAMASGTSVALQTEMLQVQTHVEVMTESRFEEDEILKTINAHLVQFSNDLAERIGQVRRGDVSEPDPDLGMRPPVGEGRSSEGEFIFPLPFILTISDMMDGRTEGSGSDHELAISCIEEHMESLVETLNKEIYMSLSAFLRRGGESKEKVQFEESLQTFMDNAHMDKLVPGRATFWNWYFGLDHLEREVRGWTLDRKRGAIELLWERFSQKESFHLVAAVDNNPRLVFPSLGKEASPDVPVGGAMDGKVATYAVGFPEKGEFVGQVTEFIGEQVADHQGMSGNEVESALSKLYDRCQGKMRFYYLIRNIKNLKTLSEQGADRCEPDTAFIDRQVQDVLGQLGIEHQSDMSIENIWALRPLIALAEFERCGSSVNIDRGISRGGFTWFLNAYGSEKKLEADKYLEIMELYGILKERTGQISFYKDEIGSEFQSVIKGRTTESFPLLTTFLSAERLERFMRSMSLKDLLQLSDYLTFIMKSRIDTLKAEGDLFGFVKMDDNKDEAVSDRDRKNALLISVFIRSGLMPRIGSDERFASYATLMIGTLKENDDPKLLSALSLALERLTWAGEAGRRCVSCGAAMANAQVLCPICQTDYRPACGSCGRRVLPTFVYCPFCGSVT